jgi:hypothetical protein
MNNKADLEDHENLLIFNLKFKRVLRINTDLLKFHFQLLCIARTIIPAEIRRVNFEEVGR